MSYNAINGSYPTTSSTWVGWAEQANFIPDISPTYITTQPQQKPNSDVNHTYLYFSNGVDYKLLSHLGNCAVAKQITPSLMDPARNCWAFGVWTPGASSW